MQWSDYLVKPTHYAKHNLSRTVRMTVSPGLLYPIHHVYMLPGDRFKVHFRHLIRTNPTLAPVMGGYKVRVVAAISNLKNYAIALEGYRRSTDWQSCSLPYFNFSFPTSIDSTLYPKGTAAFHAVRETSLADYLGYERGWLPTVQQYNLPADSGSTTASIKKSAFPFLMYYDFYRNYLVNPQEGYYPIVHASRNTPDDETSPEYNTQGAKPIITMRPISELDSYMESCHSYYNGVNSGSIINLVTNASPSDPMPWIHWRTYGFNTNTDVNTFSAYHGGLVGTMFDPDLNTLWLSVANYNKLQTVRFNSSQNSGVISSSFMDIIKASALYDFSFRELMGAGTFSDFIYSQFGLSVRTDMNIPQIVYVTDSRINFEDITSQSDTESQGGSPVGQQFGVGRDFNGTPYFTISNSDHNYALLMFFVWITPQVTYRTGLDSFSHITKLSDFFAPAFDNYSLQPRFQEQINASVNMAGDDEYPDAPGGSVFSESSSIASSPGLKPYNQVLGYQPAFSEYKTDINVSRGLFVNQLDYWTLTRRVPALNSGTSSTPFSTYVYSTPVGTSTWFSKALNASVPFSVTDEDNFQCQFRFEIQARRPLSKSAIPSIR